MRKLIIDVEKLIASGLSPNDYIILLLSIKGESNYLGDINFMDKGYINLITDDLISKYGSITEKGMLVLNQEYDKITHIVQSILTQWYNFEEKTTTSQHLNSMIIWFMREYPEVNAEEIITASEEYIESVSDKKFLMYLKNFIRKLDNFGTVESELYKWVIIVRNKKRNQNNRNFDTRV